MSNEDKEPFLVSIIPFAGLALLLLIALAWRYLPERGGSGGSAQPNAARAEQALLRWQRAFPVEIPLDPERDFSRGRADAEVTLVEFSDFECPFCKNATASVDEVIEQFGDDVRVVFKNFPLDLACNPAMTQPLHANACRAAYLARCAEEQGEGNFWKAHDAMFEARDLTAHLLDQLPDRLGLDRGRLEACMGSDGTKQAVSADIAEAHGLGLTSTPSFFVNGKKVSDYRDGSLAAIVEAALASGS